MSQWRLHDVPQATKGYSYWHPAHEEIPAGRSPQKRSNLALRDSSSGLQFFKSAPSPKPWSVWTEVDYASSASSIVNPFHFKMSYGEDLRVLPGKPKKVEQSEITRSSDT